MRLLKKIIIVPILILFFFVLGRNLVPSSFAPASNTSAPSRGPAGASPNGVYSIVGTSSDLGSYSGVAWVYNGIVQRKVRYDQYLYNDNKVESIWSGTVNADSFEFTLSLSNALTAFEGFAPDATAFENPIKIYLPLEDISTEFNFSNETEGNLHETWRFQSTASSAPLWKDLRAAVVGLGDTSSIIKSLLNWSGIYQVINLYRQSPELVPYTSKAAFREAKQYYIQDKTDADFYLSNPNVLRITNKTVNPLSL
ncbi:MAG: hypothetical protein ACXVCE_17735, partial [Bacteriovorax sp.]